jgi:hypothetical protein
MLARAAVVAENVKVPNVRAGPCCRPARLGSRHRLPRLQRDDAVVKSKALRRSNFCSRYVTDWGVAEACARVCQCMPKAAGRSDNIREKDSSQRYITTGCAEKDRSHLALSFCVSEADMCPILSAHKLARIVLSSGRSDARNEQFCTDLKVHWTRFFASSCLSPGRFRRSVDRRVCADGLSSAAGRETAQAERAFSERGKKAFCDESKTCFFLYRFGRSASSFSCCCCCC